ncbi:MAG: hydrogenase [Planctomycetia bacterium]|nr:hydrogenase [Planctomycetia bacterium]
MIGNEWLLLSGILLTGFSAVPGLLFGRQSCSGQLLTTVLAVAGGICGLWGAALALTAPPAEIARFPSPIPQAEIVLAADPLSAVFLVPIFLISLLGSVYGLDYWKQTGHPDNGRKLRLFYGFLTAALAVLVLARNSVTFLLGWEAMAVSAFMLVATEDEDPEVREAGWQYLAASHAATLSLFAMFAVLYGLTGSYDLAPLAAGSISPAAANVIFLLALAGFGLKAGFMPLHFWLPSAHAMAPSHVSAMMSGVLIKMGIYGLVRITSLLPDPPVWWGGLLLAVGIVSAVLGVAFAIGQHDLKRLLAYHSIENIGIIVIGLALAVLGRSVGQETWIVLGLSGCLLHVWNHSLFKSLLFLSAGSVIHSQKTREIDHLGGLAKSMPWTAGFFLIGAAAICGLPPLNGFVSEFFIYLGLFQTLGLGTGPEYPSAAFAVPALALMGALAVACFVKVFAVVFLGTARASQPHPGHESRWTMLAPMGVLSVCCAAIGLAPPLVVPVLDHAVSVWTGGSPIGAGMLGQLAPVSQISTSAIALLASLALAAGLLRWRIRTRPFDWTETWGCGYSAPTPRMQYTASSFAQILVTLFGWALRPNVHWPRITELFPNAARFESHVPEIVLDRVVLPAFRFLARTLFWIRVMQQGSVQIYLVYVFGILVFLLLFWG